MEMNNNTVGNILMAAGILMLAPVLINGTIVIITGTANVGIKAVNSVRYKLYIKKGLKEGTIIEQDGDYYEVPFNPNHAYCKIVKEWS